MIIVPATGVLAGGSLALLSTGPFDLSPCSDDFTGATLAALWSNTSVNSGTVAPYPSLRLLRLDTGTTAASAASLRTAATVTNIFARTTVATRVLIGGTGTTTSLEIWRMQLRVDANNLATIRAIRTNGLREIEATLTVDGIETARVRQPVGRAQLPGFPVSLSVLRFGSRVLLFNGATVVLDAEWIATAATVDLAIGNDATSTRVAADLVEYQRLPLVVFGSEPSINSAVVRGTSASVLVPSSTKTGAVDVTAYGCSTSTTISGGYTYAVSDRDIRLNQDIERALYWLS